MTDILENTLLQNDDDTTSIADTPSDVANIKDHREIYANIYKTQKKLQPFLTKYERARLIGVRAQQLSNGATALVDTTNLKDVVQIAEEELKQRVIPLIIRRSLANGKYEDWKIDEFTII